jgi:hypothetical protein
MMHRDSEGSGQAVSGLPPRRGGLLPVADAKEPFAKLKQSCFG